MLLKFLTLLVALPADTDKYCLSLKLLTKSVKIALKLIYLGEVMMMLNLTNIHISESGGGAIVW